MENGGLRELAYQKMKEMIYQILIILKRYRLIMKKDSKVWEMLLFKK